MCTYRAGISDVELFPHRQFFGIADSQFDLFSSLHDEERWGKKFTRYNFQQNFPYGIMPIEDILQLEQIVGYQPKPSDIAQVQLVLSSKGLPLELVLTILDFAEYTPTRRLEILHDAPHPGNRDELRKYLTFCWQLMLRCEVMARALGSAIDWKKLVSNIIMEFWGDWHRCSYHSATGKMANVEWGLEGPEINEMEGYKATFI
jgi:hypothetical protein